MAQLSQIIDQEYLDLCMYMSQEIPELLTIVKVFIPKLVNTREFLVLFRNLKKSMLKKYSFSDESDVYKKLHKLRTKYQRLRRKYAYDSSDSLRRQLCISSNKLNVFKIRHYSPHVKKIKDKVALLTHNLIVNRYLILEYLHDTGNISEYAYVIYNQDLRIQYAKSQRINNKLKKT